MSKLAKLAEQHGLELKDGARCSHCKGLILKYTAVKGTGKVFCRKLHAIKPQGSWPGRNCNLTTCRTFLKPKSIATVTRVQVRISFQLVELLGGLYRATAHFVIP